MAKSTKKTPNLKVVGEEEEDLIGNAKPRESKAGGVAAAQLRTFVERIERLNEEKRSLADDIKDVFAEAKGNGFDTKAMRKIIAERKMDAAERQEFESVLDIYRHALGMLFDE